MANCIVSFSGSLNKLHQNKIKIESLNAIDETRNVCKMASDRMNKVVAAKIGEVICKM